MAASSEIEKLERRYAENPDGRYFAPLADAYRKAGQVDRALELVRAGIEKHADYLSAHIVLGRCMLDKKDDGGAGQAFQRVLALDAENIIALKSLAEIEERRGDLVQAREWLQKLLHIDPMNADAEADLQRLGGAIASAPTAPMEAITVEPEPAEAGFSFADVIPTQEPVPARELEILPPHPPEAPPTTLEVPSLVVPSEGVVPSQFAPPSGPVPVQELDVKPFDDSLAWGTGERSSRSVSQRDVEQALKGHEESVTEPSQYFEPAEGAAEPHVEPEHVPTQEAWETGAGDAWSGQASPQTTAPDLSGLDVDRAEPAGWDASGAAEPAAEFSLPEAAPPEVELGAEPGGALEMPELSPAEMAPEMSLADLPIIMPEEEPALAGLPLVVEPALEAAPAEPEAAPLLTETMGDLYLKQGFKAEAAEVYRCLLEQRPGDEGLLSKLAFIEGPPPSLSAAALGTESSRSWLRRLAVARVTGPAPAAVAVAAEGPTPMEQAFSQPEPPPEATGEPAHPAADSFTLDTIFGAQGGVSAAPAAEPAPEPAPAPPPTGTSFDEFFGAPPEQGSVRPDTNAQPAPAPDEDINSFNAWLRGLKR